MVGCSSANCRPCVYFVLCIFPTWLSIENVSVVIISVAVSTVPDKGRTRLTCAVSISANAHGLRRISSVKRAVIFAVEGTCNIQRPSDQEAIPGGQSSGLVKGFPIFLRIRGRSLSVSVYGVSLIN